MDAALEDYYRVSEIQLSYVSKIKASDRPKVVCSDDSHRIFRQHWNDSKLDFIEQSKILLLNRANRVLGIYELSTGCTVRTIIDPRMVFMAALKANATSIILTHNHPSENLEPSHCDRETTEQIKKAGEVLNISMLDHIILSRTGYYSFADETAYPFAAKQALLRIKQK